VVVSDSEYVMWVVEEDKGVKRKEG